MSIKLRTPAYGVVLLALCLTATAAARASSADRFRFEHLFQIEQVVGAEISPDGDSVAVVTERRKPDGYYSLHRRIWLVDSAGGEPRPLPADPADSLELPVWSPDSKRLLYRATRDKKARLVMFDLAGGRPRDLNPCTGEETVGTLAFSPDARQLAAICSGASPIDPATRPKDDPAKQPSAKPLEKKRFFATRSGLYDATRAEPWSPERRAVIVDLTDDRRIEVKRTTNLLDEPGSLQWLSQDSLWLTETPPNAYGGMPFADGRILTRYRTRDGGLDPPLSIPNTTRSPVLTGNGDFIAPVGGTVASGGPEGFRRTWELEPFEIHRTRNGILGRQSLASLEIYLSREARFEHVDDPTDRSSGGILYFTWFDRGSNRVKAFHSSPRDGEQWQDITPAGTSIAAFSLAGDGSRMALVQGDASTPNDVYVLDLANPSAAPRRVTHFGDKVAATFKPSDVELVSWRSADDRFDIEGWLLKPAGYERGKRYPLILLVHGGPGVAFRNNFNAIHLEGAHQVPPESYLSEGYLVLMANPRGDPGYGRGHQEAILEGWDYPTRYDLVHGVEEMVERGYADPDRLAIAGASYGGWVSAFAVTQTGIFKAASANDPVIDTNISSATAYRGNRNSNYWLHSGFVDGHLLDVPFPAADPRLVKSPILLRFGLRAGPPEDVTMPSQFFVSGLEYFTYLHTHCKPVEMILHPDEGHGVFDGETWRDYVETDLAWFRYWLDGKGERPYKEHQCHP